MAIIGLILVMYNALSYFFGWESRNSAFTILGLVFVVIGMKRVRNTKFTLSIPYLNPEKS
jgi:hypothetical protein